MKVLLATTKEVKVKKACKRRNPVYWNINVRNREKKQISTN